MAMDAASVSCMFYGLQVYKSLFILFPCIHRAKEYAKQHVGCLMHSEASVSKGGLPKQTSGSDWCSATFRCLTFFFIDGIRCLRQGKFEIDSSLLCTADLESLWESLCVTLHTGVIPSNRDVEFVCFQGHVEEQSIQLDQDRGGSLPVFLFHSWKSQVCTCSKFNLARQPRQGPGTPAKFSVAKL